MVGAVVLRRTKAERFSDKQIVLLETFAEPAVIAIEGTRLFEEVQARNRELATLGEVGRAVSRPLDPKVVLKTIIDRAVSLPGADGGAIFYYRKDVGTLELGETAGLDEQAIATTGCPTLRRAQLAWDKLQPITRHFPDMAERPGNPLRDTALKAGLRAALIVPVLGAEGPRGALVLPAAQAGQFSAGHRQPHAEPRRPVRDRA